MSSIKRLNNEIKKYNEKQKKYICEIVFDNEKKYISVYYNDNILLTLLAPDCYPFKPYKIINYEYPFYNKRLYHNDSYLRFISKYSKIPFFICWFLTVKYRKQKFSTLTNVNCFCCESVTCPNNWMPRLTIDNLINEYIDARIINFYSSKLMSRHLKYLFSYFDKINDDNMNMIMDFCLE